MRVIKNLAFISSLTISSLLVFGATPAHAECVSYTRRDNGYLVTLPIYKYQVGSSAFANLLNIGFDEAGRIIGAAHDWLGDCSYPGIGISAASGSGEMVDGIYPNDASVVYAIYGGGVNLTTARSAIYAVISASPEPAQTTTTTVAPTTSSTTTTTTTVPTTIAPVEDSAPPETTTTTTTNAPLEPLAISITNGNYKIDDVDLVDLSVKKVGTQYRIEIVSVYRKQPMEVRTRISNRKTVTWNITTNAKGGTVFYTNRNLKGRTVSLWVIDGKIDSVKVK